LDFFRIRAIASSAYCRTLADLCCWSLFKEGNASRPRLPRLPATAAACHSSSSECSGSRHSTRASITRWGIRSWYSFENAINAWAALILIMQQRSSKSTFSAGLVFVRNLKLLKAITAANRTFRSLSLLANAPAFSRRPLGIATSAECAGSAAAGPRSTGIFGFWNRKLKAIKHAARVALSLVSRSAVNSLSDIFLSSRTETAPIVRQTVNPITKKIGIFLNVLILVPDVWPNATLFQYQNI